MPKKGRIGQKERDMIISYLSSEKDEQIASRFDRTIEVIKKIRLENQAVENNPPPENEYVALLHTRYFWNTIKRQLVNQDEFTYFEMSWAALYQQYVGSEVAHTDEMMIKDLIMLDILLNRALEDRRNLSAETEDLRRRLETAKRLESEAERVERVSTLNRSLSQVIAALETANKLANDLQTKKDKKFEQLKGTRDQRFKTAEQSKTNFFERIKYLDEASNRKEQGRRNELIKLSAAKFQFDLEQEQQYEDGEWTRPFLTPDAIMRANDEQTEKDNEVRESQEDSVDAPERETTEDE